MLAHALLQWPYLSDLTLISAITSVFHAEWGLAPKQPPAWLQLKRNAWLYFNLVLTDSQVCACLCLWLGGNRALVVGGSAQRCCPSSCVGSSLLLGDLWRLDYMHKHSNQFGSGCRLLSPFCCCVFSSSCSCLCLCSAPTWRSSPQPLAVHNTCPQQVHLQPSAVSNIRARQWLGCFRCWRGLRCARLAA